MNVKLWEISSTERAIEFSTLPKGDGGRTVWVPRSQIRHISRDRSNSGEWPTCLVDVEDWLVEKEEL